MTSRRGFFLQLLGAQRERHQALYEAEQELVLAYNAWAARLGENIRNGIVDVRVYKERKKLEGLWMTLWKRVEEWSRGW